MPIFTKEEQRQKRLIYLLIIVFLITAFVLWYGFFRPPSPQIGPIGAIEPIGPIEEVGEIDFTVLESPFLRELQPFEEIEPFKEEIGRENPFIPY